MKKQGGIIRNWQFHHLSITKTQAIEKYGLDIKTDQVMVFSGTVVEDYAGRWNPGDHMRSSVITDYDPETGICETQKTIYVLEGEGGDDVLPDLGDNIAKIYY